MFGSSRQSTNSFFPQLLSIVLIFIGILVYRKIDDFKLLLRKYSRTNWRKKNVIPIIRFDSYFCILAEEISKYTLFLAFFGSVLCAISCHGSYCVFTRNKHVLTAVSGWNSERNTTLKYYIWSLIWFSVRDTDGFSYYVRNDHSGLSQNHLYWIVRRCTGTTCSHICQKQKKPKIQRFVANSAN